MIAHLGFVPDADASVVPQDSSIRQLLAALDGLTLWADATRGASSETLSAGSGSALALARADALRKLLDAAPVGLDSSQSDALTARLLLSDLAVVTGELRASTRDIRARLDAIRAEFEQAKLTIDRLVASSGEVSGPPAG